MTVAKSVLASFWGELENTQFSVVGAIIPEPENPDFTTLASRLTTTAPLARYEAEKHTQKAVLDLENARATPNLQVFAGGRYLNEDDGNAGFIARIQIPWPLFDKNQGNIRTAWAQLKAVDHKREATRRELLIRLKRAHQQLLNAQADASVIQS